MRPRYAIYFSPKPDSQLWRDGATWLGRDPRTGERQSFPTELNVDGWEALSSSARRYGFHATLKPPMHLVSNTTEESLIGAIEAWAAQRAAFEVQLRCAVLGRFVALVPSDSASSVALSELASDCVLAFDHLRAPLTEDDIARRRKAKLSPAQDALMLRYGYPYVLHEFRFHMTLSNAIEDEAVRERVVVAASSWFEDELSRPLLIDRVALFQERRAGEDFCHLRDFEFARS